MVIDRRDNHASFGTTVGRRADGAARAEVLAFSASEAPTGCRRPFGTKKSEHPVVGISKNRLPGGFSLRRAQTRFGLGLRFQPLAWLKTTGHPGPLEHLEVFRGALMTVCDMPHAVCHKTAI
jgi:hypothetical protein